MPDANTPNILFFFTDQQRHDWVGMNPRIPVRTPHLERLADEGVYFTNAVCPSPICGPSRACLASGMEYDDCGVLDHTTNYPLDERSLYRRLRDEAGYHVMGCGKFDLHKPEFNWGVDGQHCLDEWGFSAGQDSAGKWATKNSWQEHGGPNDPYMAHLQERGLAEDHLEDYRKRSERGRSATFPTPLPDDAYSDNFVAETGLDLVDAAPAGEPWFLQVNFPGPHNPWDVTHEMHGWYRGENAVDFPGPAPVTSDGAYTAERHNEIRRNYAAMVENVDRWLGRYREHLRENGEWENTVVVFASDHGELLGDHGRWTKQRPYQPSVGVPMVVSGPGLRAGHVSHEPATILDLHATFAELGGLDPGDVDSRSLLPLLAGRTDEHREYVYSGLGAWRLAFDGRYKLVTGFDPQGDGVGEEMDADADPLLFDLDGDVHETTNVVDDNPGVADRLRERIEVHRTDEGMDNSYTR
jgi:choline-sulfatase